MEVIDNATKSVQISVCSVFPTKVNSHGFFKQLAENNKTYLFTDSYGKTVEKQRYEWLDYSGPRLQLQISVIFILTQAFHFLLKPIGIPVFVSQIIAGLILSQAVAGRIWKEEMIDFLNTNDSIQILGSLGGIGYAFFLFHSGVKMDLSMVAKAGKKAFCVGALCVLAPLVYSVLIITSAIDNEGRKYSFLARAPLFYLTSFPVVNMLLTELKILNSEIGRIGNSSAMVADLLSLGSALIFRMYEVIKEADDTKDAWSQLGVMLSFIFLVGVILRLLMLLLVRLTPEGKPVNKTCVYGIILCFVFYMKVIFWFDKFSYPGYYLLGLAVPHGPPLGSELLERFDCVVSGLFLPLFVSLSAVRIKPLSNYYYSIFDGKFFDMIKEDIMISVPILVIKFLACYLASLYAKMPKKDALALALILSSKGIIELSIQVIWLDNRIISQEVYSTMVFIITIVASIVPAVLKRLYHPSRKFAGYQKRKIMDLKPGAELKIIACIHVPTNVNSVINFLRVSYPRKENPIAVNVLHLVKLNGQATPIFISYQNKGRDVTYSENVILSFKKFEANDFEAVSVKAFTAISPPSLMHDDICNLALDNRASLIILPFHRTWYTDGSIEFEDHNIRNLNCMVLERSPCSIGILIDHGNRKHPMHVGSSSYKVVMLFLGGNDDREALAYAKRMAEDRRVSLTVAHIIAESEENGEANWETILDSEVLRDVKTKDGMIYRKHVVDDGPETVKFVHSMMSDEYDLVIVGRNYDLDSQTTSGLKEWSEFPELGILGDLLASKDLGIKCSVLIVQQQRSIV